MEIFERVKARKEKFGWIVWDKQNRLYFWYPYEELTEEKLTTIIDNNYRLNDLSSWNEKRMCFRLSAPLRIYYDITYKCNLNCWYCYNKTRLNISKELSLSQKKQIVDQMVINGIYKLSIAGGEPLLSNDLFAFAEYAVQNEISVSITTNGTLISSQNIDKLEIFDSISISIDHIDENSTDLNVRQPVKYSSQIDGIIQNLPSKLLKKVGIKAVINPNDSFCKSQFDRLAKYCMKRKIGKLKISVLQEDNIKYSEELYTKTYELLDYIEHMKTKYASLRISYNSNPFSSNFSISNYIVQSGCGCWKDLLIITPYGKIKPCLLFNEDFEIASIQEDSLKNIWEKNFEEKKLPEECIICEKYGSCLGGCTARRVLLGYEKDPLCMKLRNVESMSTETKSEFQNGSLVYCFSHC